MVQPNKKLAWDRCMGQEQPKKGYFVPEDNAAHTSPADEHRVLLEVTNGAQTPKLSQEGLTLLIPLLFWCNQDLQRES